MSEDGWVRSYESWFADSVRYCRHKARLSQEQVVRRLEAFGVHMHPPALSKIENGHRRLTLGEALALSMVLDLPNEDACAFAYVRETLEDLAAAAGVDVLGEDGTPRANFYLVDDIRERLAGRNHGK